MAKVNVPVRSAVSPEDLKAVGGLAINSTYLEVCIESLIVQLLGAEADRDALLANLTVRSKRELLGALVIRRIGDSGGWVERWKKLEKSIERLYDERRHIIHGVLRWDPKEGLVAQVSKARRQASQRPFEKSYIIEIAEQMEDLVDDLREFVSSVRSTFPETRP